MRDTPLTTPAAFASPRLTLLGLLAAVAVALVLPAESFGHATEFILAKVIPRPGGVDVEVTADYGGNPMLTSEAEARRVLSHLLRVRAGETDAEIASFAAPRFEERTAFDPTTPIPLDAEGETHPHQLLWAAWSWKCRPGSMAFAVEKDAGQTVILWTPPATPGGKVHWVFLMPGEVSPAIVIPRAARPKWEAACAGLGMFGLVPALAILCFRRKRSPLNPPASLGKDTSPGCR